MRIQCPCCGNYPYVNLEEADNHICPICYWQYDSIANKRIDQVIGPNNVPLTEARIHYEKYKVSELEFSDCVRHPLTIELPENNQ